jgi:hypothetical protein
MQTEDAALDDHCYYHHSVINQSLHFVSAASFLFGYVMIFFDPMVSALVGWLLSTPRARLVTSLRAAGLRPRQPGDPRTQGEIKVGYNLAARRADDDLGVVAAGFGTSPDPVRHVHSWASPADFRVRLPRYGLRSGSVGFCSPSICSSSATSGWPRLMTKILTDPFSDPKLYQGADLSDEGRTDRPGLEKHVKHA